MTKQRYRTKSGVTVECQGAVVDIRANGQSIICMTTEAFDAIFQPIEEPPEIICVNCGTSNGCNHTCLAATTDFTEAHVGEKYREAGIREVIAWLDKNWAKARHTPIEEVVAVTTDHFFPQSDAERLREIADRGWPNDEDIVTLREIADRMASSE